jgi:ElaB/YqjD/DUF883 family membrane-anchored ribosome-binding protein
MDIEKNECEKQQKAGDDSDSPAVQNILERGAEFYGQAEQAVTGAYDKTTQTVSETYGKAKKYSSENPGKLILISLGIGIGVGFFLSVCSHRSRTDPNSPTRGV